MENSQELPKWKIQANKKLQIQAELLKPYLAQTGEGEQTSSHLLESNGGTYLHQSWIEPKLAREITDVDDIGLLRDKIASGEYTAVDVIDAYTKRATAAHQAVNCLTEVCFDDALRQARELDAYFEQHQKPIGPLHGVPITLKDQFNVKGYDSTLGYVGRAFRPAKEDAVVVAILKKLGAVILAKTNLPQSILWGETENPLFGLTVNPRDHSFTPGGSTGGEGALLDLHGSIVGFGTDVGGSIRIPCHMLGLYGLKPSSSRLPYEGVPVSTEGQNHIPSVIGPMTRTLSSLTLVTKSIIDAAPWNLDPGCIPLPWQEAAYAEMSTRPLTIGLLVDDGIVKVHPPVERVVLEVAAKLKAAGHEIVPWNASGHAECMDIINQYYSVDGGEDIRRDVLAGGEPFIPHVEALINRGPAISVYAYWQLNRAKLAAQKAYLDKWNSILSPTTNKPVDVLLTPVSPHCATPHRCGGRWAGYSKIWNFFDYSTVTLPACKVLSSVDGFIEDHNPRNPHDALNWQVWKDHKERMDGMPVGVQLVGRKLEEERVLGAAEVVVDIIGEN